MTELVDVTTRLPRRREIRNTLEATEPDAGLQYVVVESRPPDPRGERNLAGAFRQLWRRSGLVLLITLAGTALAAAAAWSIPSLYVAEARLLVGTPAPRALKAEAVLPEPEIGAERLQDESLILKSRAIARQVTDKLHLADNPYFKIEPPWSPWTYVEWLAQCLPQAAAWLHAQGLDLDPSVDLTAEQRENRLIGLLMSRLDVAMLGRSHVLSIKAEAPDGATAALIANAFADDYVAFQRQEKIETLDRVDKFLTDRIDELHEEVRRTDQAVEDYRRSNELYKSGSGSVATQQLAQLNSQLMGAQSAKIEAEARLREAKALSAGSLGSESVPEVLVSPVVTGLKQQLADAERRASQAAASYGDRHPMLRNARAESAAIAGLLSIEVAKIVDGLAREARSAAARYDALLANFERVKAEMGVVNDKSIQLDALERDAAVNRKLLETMLNRAKQTIGTVGMVQANAKIISPAAIPERSSFPPKALLLFLGTLGGFLIAASMAVLLEVNDRTFRRSEEIESLTGLPVLAMLPQVRPRTAAKQVLRDPSAPYSKALHHLSLGVELSQVDVPPRILMVSSAIPAEGKSTTVAALGRHLASNGKRVLLIDCDGRSPRLHQNFRCSNAKGLVNLLVEENALLNDCIHHDGQSGVDVVPAGHWESRMLQLLASQRMAQLVEAFAHEYEVVILDTPPVLVTADAIALARLAEKVVFVVRWGSTRREAVLEALKQLLEAQADIAGVAVSRVVARQFRRYAPVGRAPARPVPATFGA
jgi:succinoglycan biosynthesis transport protein ExoP